MDQFDDFISLYSQIPSIHQLKPQFTEEYKAFVTKIGLPVKALVPSSHRSLIPFITDFDSFFYSDKAFWMIPCDLPDQGIIGFIFRGMFKKTYRVIAPEHGPQVLFGLSTFSSFHCEHNFPIIVTEGAKDALFIQNGYYPFTVSICSGTVSADTFNVLCSLTRKVILAFDNDPAGKDSFQRYSKQFNERGVSTLLLIPPKKDWGSYFSCSPGMDLKLASAKINSILLSAGVQRKELYAAV